MFSVLCVMPGYQSTIGIEMTRKAGFLRRLALVPDGRNDFPALVIIHFGNSYGYGIEEDTAHEEI
jgi:hypothetical protein